MRLRLYKTSIINYILYWIIDKESTKNEESLTQKRKQGSL